EAVGLPGKAWGLVGHRFLLWCGPGHLNPVSEIELTMVRWKTVNSTNSGAIAIVVAAITSVQFALCWPCRAAVATVIACQSSPAVRSGGHMKLFQGVTTVMTATLTMIGRDNGTLTNHRMRHGPAPSMRAAETRPSGMPRKYSRNRNTAYGEPNTNGTTNDQ